MKNIPLLYFFTSFFIACNSETKPVTKENAVIVKPQKEEFDQTLSTTKNLIGEWGIYASVNGGLEINCYRCPRIIFYKDLTGVIIQPSGEKEYIKWNINGNKLTISTEVVRADRTNYDGKFEIHFKKEDGFTDLVLTKIGTKRSYILSK